MTFGFSFFLLDWLFSYRSQNTVCILTLFSISFYFFLVKRYLSHQLPEIFWHFLMLVSTMILLGVLDLANLYGFSVTPLFRISTIILFLLAFAYTFRLQGSSFFKLGLAVLMYINQILIGLSLYALGGALACLGIFKGGDVAGLLFGLSVLSSSHIYLVAALFYFLCAIKDLLIKPREKLKQPIQIENRKRNHLILIFAKMYTLIAFGLGILVFVGVSSLNRMHSRDSYSATQPPQKASKKKPKSKSINPNQFLPIYIIRTNDPERLEPLKLATQKGVDINALNNHGQTALIFAAQENLLESVKFLLDNGAAVDARDENGKTAFIRTVEIKSLAANLFSTERNPDSQGDRFKILKLLIDHGANVNAKSDSGFTALSVAVAQNDVGLVRFLLQNGADVNARVYLNKPLLQSALERNSLSSDTVQLLLDGGVDVNATGIEGQTVLWTAFLKSNVDIIKLLVSYCHVNAKNQDGNTVLHLMSIVRLSNEVNASVFPILVKRGADPNVKNNRGQTPLMLAIQNGHVEMAKAFLEKGAQIDLRDNEGKTLLMMSKHYQEYSLIIGATLLGKGVNVNEQDTNGNTALIHAVMNDDRLFAQFLLEHGADVSIKNKSHETALDIAKQYRKSDIVSLFEDNQKIKRRTLIHSKKQDSLPSK